MLLSRPGPVLPLATFAASVGVVFLFLHGVEGIGLLSTGWTAQYRIDLDVYRQAAQAWLTGRPLYTEVFPTGYGESLPFVYPPIAAVLVVPLASVPMPLAATLLTVVSAALVPVVGAAMQRAVGRPVRARWLAAATPVVLLTDPVRLVLFLGQVNIVLVGLVAAGLLARGAFWDRWRGAPIGLAAAVKLTPLVFVVWLVLRGDRGGAVVALVTFAASIVLGAVLAPADSVTFWSGRLSGVGTPLDLGYVDNQSLRGILVRLGGTGPVTIGLWCVAAAAVGAAALVLARRCVREGAPLLGAAVLAVAGTLVSPISWSHHWVWVLAFGPVLVEHARRSRSRALCGVLLAGVPLFAIGPHWLVRNGSGGVPDQLVAAHLPLWGLAVLAAIAWSLRRDTAAEMHPTAARHARGQP